MAGGGGEEEIQFPTIRMKGHFSTFPLPSFKIWPINSLPLLRVFLRKGKEGEEPAKYCNLFMNVT